MELKTKLVFLRAVSLMYGSLLMVTTFTYYNLLQNALDGKSMDCKDFVEETGIRDQYDFQEEQDFCKGIGTWATCSIVAFIAGILTVASTIYSCMTATYQASPEHATSQTLYKTYFFYIVQVIVVAALSFIIMIIMIDSKAITAHAGTNIPWNLQLAAIVTVAMLLLPTIVLVAATTVVVVIMTLRSFCSNAPVREGYFNQVPTSQFQPLKNPC